jgi:hypothetical protein
MAAAVVGGPGGATPWEEPFRIQVGGVAGRRPPRDPPAALTAYLAKTLTAATILQAPEAVVKRIAAAFPRIVWIFIDRALCVVYLHRASVSPDCHGPD